MSLPASNSLSFIAQQVAGLLEDRVTQKPKVVIGPPSEALLASAGGSPTLCLFFHRVEPSGFYPETGSNDPFYLRLHCLITAFGKHKDHFDGEINLRLLGDVIRIFHEYPVHNWRYDYSFQHPPKLLGATEGTVEQTTINENVTLNVQAIFCPVTTEELNQIWYNQGDATFRTSVAYEFSLAPIYPHDIKPETTRVGQIRANVMSSKQSSGTPTNDGGFSLAFKGVESRILRKFGNFDTSNPPVFKIPDDDNGDENDRVTLTLDAANMPDPPAGTGSRKFQLQAYQKSDRKLEAISDPIDIPSSATGFDLKLETSDGLDWLPGTYWVMAETLDEDPVSYSNVLTIEISAFIPTTGADL